MCRSVLEYASPVWDPYLHRGIDNLERIQRKGAMCAEGLSSAIKRYEHVTIPEMGNSI